MKLKTATVCCYKCNATVEPVLQKISKATGHLAYRDPNTNITVVAPTAQQQWAAFCPRCGALFQSAEADKKNDDEERIKYIIIFGLPVLFGILFFIMMLATPKR